MPFAPPADKAGTKHALQQAMLAQCPEDIQQLFAPHSYTVEPLLLAILASLQRIEVYLAAREIT